jgi:metal transporter CNNM
MRFRFTLLLILLAISPAVAELNLSKEKIENAAFILKSIGASLCHPSTDRFAPALPKCEPIQPAETVAVPATEGNPYRQLEEVEDASPIGSIELRQLEDGPPTGSIELRQLEDGREYDDTDDYIYGYTQQIEELQETVEDLEGQLGPKSDWFYIYHAIGAILCVCLASVTSTMLFALISLDPLLIHIKMRAASTDEERKEAELLLPLVKQQHLMIISMILLNAGANESLPLFLEVMMSPAHAVFLSVMAVLIFCEIMPSALISGPRKLRVVSRLSWFAWGAMFLLWPLAYPIAKLTEHMLHGGGEEEDDGFNRGELSALVRIQYEERMASKQRRRAERVAFNDLTKNGKCPPELMPTKDALMAASIRAAKRELGCCDHVAEFDSDDNDDNSVASSVEHHLHVDEVTMVQGALQMKTKKVIDVYTPWRKVFAVPHNMVLNEQSVVHIYSNGYSRIPVYVPNAGAPNDHCAVRGVLLIKQLIVVRDSDRHVFTLPLRIPVCVGPHMNLVKLLNLFQTGGTTKKGGHMALVCAWPEIGNMALDQGLPLPEEAVLMG